MSSSMSKTFRWIFSLCNIAMIFALAGCGGGSGASSSSPTVSGVASVGAPLSGQVTLKDSSSAPLQKSATITSDGSYSIDVTGMKAPFILQATGTAGGTSYTLHSFASDAGTANTNPMSNMLVAGASGVDDPSEVFEHPTPQLMSRIEANLPEIKTAVAAKLAHLLERYGAENEDAMTGHFHADHHGLDGVFDSVRISISNGVVTITNAATGAVIFTANITDLKNGEYEGDDTLPTPPPTTQPPTNPSAPSAPTGLTATGGANQVTVSWGAVTEATSYNLYYATTAGVTAATGTKVANVVSPYVQTGLATGTTYYYVVTAVNAGGESAASTMASASTSAAVPAPTVPSAPTGVTVSGGANQVSVSWSAVSGATGYNVYYSTASGVTAANGTKVAGAASPAVITGLAAGTAYYVIVTATNATGESAASAQASATTTAAAPAFDGAAYYTANCAGCHGALGSSNKQGATAAQISAGIARVSSMNRFSTLTAAQIAAIAAALL